MKQNDHIPKDNALRQALRLRAERCMAENPVPADLEGLVMQRILRSKQQPATRRRSLMRLLPWSIAAALLVGFTLMKALYQLPHEGEKTLSPLPREGEKTLSPLPREGESLATLESSRQVGNFTSHKEEGKVLAMIPSMEENSPIPGRPSPSSPNRPTPNPSHKGGEFLSPDRQADMQVPPRGDLEGALPSLTGGVGGGSVGGGSAEEASPIPPEKQALADIYLAEVALQVAYRKQAAEEAVRAYQAGITGEETRQPIIAF
ncbi:MAG: hypothetical protein IJK15_08610 [Bacteroidaceae bacterium]|nr:hypothetical protein [Bacteroidaceae bacterium]